MNKITFKQRIKLYCQQTFGGLSNSILPAIILYAFICFEMVNFSKIDFDFIKFLTVFLLILFGLIFLSIIINLNKQIILISFIHQYESYHTSIK